MVVARELNDCEEDLGCGDLILRNFLLKKLPRQPGCESESIREIGTWENGLKSIERVSDCPRFIYQSNFTNT